MGKWDGTIENKTPIRKPENIGRQNKARDCNRKQKLSLGIFRAKLPTLRTGKGRRNVLNSSHAATLCQIIDKPIELAPMTRPKYDA